MTETELASAFVHTYVKGGPKGDWQCDFPDSVLGSPMKVFSQ